MHYINSKLLLIITTLIIVISSTLADYKDPTTKVNINQQTDLFDKSVNNWSGLQQQLDADKDSAIKGGGSADITFLAGKNANELQAESINLNSIKAIDLNDRGRKQMLKENIIDDLYIDESKPLNEEHFQDAKRLATGQDKLLANLLEKLKELGVDCKAEKGLKEVEPTYYMQVEQKQHKDTKYNKTTCEELRNKYNCTDTLKLSCKKRGMKWNPWQYREVQIAGDTVYHGAKHLGYAVFWKKKRWGWHLTFDSAGWRVFLSNHFGIPLEQIHEQIHFPGGARGIGGNHPIYEHWRIVFDAYLFGYNYRDGHEICEEWVEDWTENCRLQ